MIKTAYLRIYQPLSSFPRHEQEQWIDSCRDTEGAEPKVSRRWLIASSLPDAPDLATPTEGAFVREVDGEMLICPWRTRLRMLAGLLAFRNSVPEEVAEAFVPETEARRAAHELAVLGDERPEVRSHILHANWHVPLRWFACFEDSERILTEDKDGLRVRYETRLNTAAQRLSRAVAILENKWIDDGVIAAVRELHEWLADFDTDGLLELDYGSVAGMFSDDELVEDRSAGEVAACLDALETEDVIRAGRIFGSLTDRWTEARAKEVVN
ncbi:MAG: hypothetical protein M3198_06055 [Actinomycetota bacterium]|nr:hypothetical protein [Actinomycetota bacterium]